MSMFTGGSEWRTGPRNRRRRATRGHRGRLRRRPRLHPVPRGRRSGLRVLEGVRRGARPRRRGHHRTRTPVLGADRGGVDHSGALVRALDAGMTPDRFFAFAEEVDVEAPLVCMTYYNLIYQYGGGGRGAPRMRAVKPRAPAPVPSSSAPLRPASKGSSSSPTSRPRRPTPARGVRRVRARLGLHRRAHHGRRPARSDHGQGVRLRLRAGAPRDHRRAQRRPTRPRSRA